MKVKDLMWCGFKFKVSGDADALNNLCTVFRDAAAYNREHGYPLVAEGYERWANQIHAALEACGAYGDVED